MGSAQITRVGRYCYRLALMAILGGCAGSGATPPAANEYGPTPTLVTPQTRLLPTINPRKAIGWTEDALPLPAAGLQVQAFARDLSHPRWLFVLPNNDILVAESNRPAGSGGMGGLKGWLADKIMSYAGAGGVSPDRITLLRDSDGDGVADLRTTFIEDLHSPFGMALVGNTLFVANTDAVLTYRYREDMTRVESSGARLADLPAGPLNHHWTKSLVASADGKTMYVGVGSNSNIGENGLAEERNRAAILSIDIATGRVDRHATGLRNPVGLAWEPDKGTLWTVVNERDELGDQLVPDYLTEIHPGGFYGWPHWYWGDHRDTRVTAPDPNAGADIITPDYALGAHTASLGLSFYQHAAIPWLTGAAIIGQHGSWNRSEPSGYKVIAVPFTQGQPAGTPIDLLTGFLDNAGNARGRPAGVAVDHRGAILIADDAGDTVWRVMAHPESAVATKGQSNVVRQGY